MAFFLGFFGLFGGFWEFFGGREVFQRGVRDSGLEPGFGPLEDVGDFWLVDNIVPEVGVEEQLFVLGLDRGHKLKCALGFHNSVPAPLDNQHRQIKLPHDPPALSHRIEQTYNRS